MKIKVDKLLRMLYPQTQRVKKEITFKSTHRSEVIFIQLSSMHLERILFTEIHCIFSCSQLFYSKCIFPCINYFIVILCSVKNT